MAQYLILDIHCRPCRPGWRDGDPHPPPRLGRFVRDASGEIRIQLPSRGGIRIQTFTHKGLQAISVRHQRPDGGMTWQLICPHGHYKPIQDERIAAAFDAFPPGTERMRVPL
jgi:hypothetical protein